MERKVSPEQIKDLRKIIDQQLRSKDVYNQIREILSDYLNMDHSKSEVHSEEHVSSIRKYTKFSQLGFY